MLNTERLDDLAVPLDVLLEEIVEETTSLVHQCHQSSTSGKVLRVGLEVGREVGDPLGHTSHLELRRASVRFVTGVLAADSIEGKLVEVRSIGLLLRNGGLQIGIAKDNVSIIVYSIVLGRHIKPVALGHEGHWGVGRKGQGGGGGDGKGKGMEMDLGLRLVGEGNVEVTSVKIGVCGSVG